MEILKNGSQPSIKGPADWYTGNVRIELLFLRNAPSCLSGAILSFDPGARSAWHSHPLGQTIFITSGCGWMQCEGGPRVEICAGDVVHCSPGQKHWHGATATTAVTQICVQEAVDGKFITWMEQVTDEEYLRGDCSA